MWLVFAAYGKLAWSSLLTVEVWFGHFLLTVENWFGLLVFFAYGSPIVNKKDKP